MAALDIVLYPDAPLRDKAGPVTDFGPELVQLKADMLETMEAFEGVGLAGPQVGLAKRLFVLREPDGEGMCLVNPEISEAEGSETGEEGCLSLPRLYANVPRATHIRVRAQNELGEPLDFEARGFLARIIQHENDHLDGIVFPDRLDILTRESLLHEWAEIRKALLGGVT